MLIFIQFCCTGCSDASSWSIAISAISISAGFLTTGTGTLIYCELSIFWAAFTLLEFVILCLWYWAGDRNWLKEYCGAMAELWKWPAEGVVPIKAPALPSVGPSWVDMLLYDWTFWSPLLKPGAFLFKDLTERSACCYLWVQACSRIFLKCGHFASFATI